MCSLEASLWSSSMEVLQYFTQNGGSGLTLGTVLSHVVSLGIFDLAMDLATLGQSTETREQQSSPTWSQWWHPMGEKVPSIWGWHGSGQHLVVAGVHCVHSSSRLVFSEGPEGNPIPWESHRETVWGCPPPLVGDKINQRC